MNQTDHKQSLLVAKFDQHWQHARHVENERLAIVGGYIAIITATLAYFRDLSLERLHVPLLIFLIIVSVACLALCIKIQLIFKHHAAEADKILTDSGLDSMVAVLDRHPLSQKWWLSVSLLFSAVFALCSSALVFALVRALCKEPQSSEAATAGLLVALFWGAATMALVLNVDYRLRTQ